MKSIRKFFEGIGVLLILAAIVSSYGMTSKKKTVRWSTVIICIFIVAFLARIGYTAFQNRIPDQDCIPATVQRVFPSHSLREMVRLMNTDKDGSTMADLEAAWPRLSTNQLYIVYSGTPQIKAIDEKIQHNHPYLWIGLGEDKLHCALVKFGETNVVVSNSQFLSGTTNYYTVSMDYDTFYSNTMAIYNSKDLSEGIRLQ